MLRRSIFTRQVGPLVALLGLSCGRDVAAADTSQPEVRPSLAARADQTLEDAPLIAASTAQGVEHPLGPAIRIAQNSLMRMQSIEDYEATLVRRERLDGQLSEQTLHLKLRERPLSVYIKYGEPSPGRELLFVQGQNENRVLIGGKAATAPVATAVTESLEPGDSRYRAADYGMRQMLERVISQWKTESLYAETDVQFYPDARLRGQPCEVIESSHPRPRRQFRFQKTRLYIDGQSRLPVRIEQLAFPAGPGQEAELDEFYEFVNVRTNVGLTDQDFDRRNPKYSF